RWAWPGSRSTWRSSRWPSPPEATTNRDGVQSEQGANVTGRFEGKVAIVTGAAGGIGEAYARGLAAEGADVVVADLDEERGEKTAADIAGAGGGDCAFVRVDVSDPDSTQAMAAATVERFGGIDLLVNNAAIYGNMQF